MNDARQINRRGHQEVLGDRTATVLYLPTVAGALRVEIGGARVPARVALNRAYTVIPATMRTLCGAPLRVCHLAADRSDAVIMAAVVGWGARSVFLEAVLWNLPDGAILLGRDFVREVWPSMLVDRRNST